MTLQARPNAPFAPSLQITGDYCRSNSFSRKEPFKSLKPLLGMKERSSFRWGKGALTSWLVSRKVLGQHRARLVTAPSHRAARCLPEGATPLVTTGRVLTE